MAALTTGTLQSVADVIKHPVHTGSNTCQRLRNRFSRVTHEGQLCGKYFWISRAVTAVELRGTVNFTRRHLLELFFRHNSLTACVAQEFFGVVPRRPSLRLRHACHSRPLIILATSQCDRLIRRNINDSLRV